MIHAYIHGFNSGAYCRSGRELAEILEAPVFCPEYDCGNEFKDNLEFLQKAISEFAGNQPLCLMGSSLGGFYALSLGLPNTVGIIAWNPVIYPALQLKGFLGANTRFTDGKEWVFTKSALYSYASANDPRRFDAAAGKMSARTIVLGTRDEILDWELAEAYWHDHAKIRLIDSAHQVESYGHVREILKNWPRES